MTVDQHGPMLSVIMVNYRSGAMLVDRLEALAIGAHVEVIVVDNASNDGSIERAMGSAPWATYVLNDENVGFARAVNIGAARASARNLCLMNPDAVIDQKELMALSKELDNRAVIGVIAPNIAHGPGVRVMEAGWEPTIRQIFTHVTGLSVLSGRCGSLRGFHARRTSTGCGLMEVDWVSGALLLTRRQVWNELGGLTERWFMYTEDIEYCHRVRSLGYRVAVAQGAPAWHGVGESVSEVSNLAGRSPTRQRRSTDTLWITTLFEYFRDELAGSRGAVVAWVTTMALGLVSRILVFRLRALLSRDQHERSNATFMAHKFQWSLHDLVRHAMSGGTK